MSLPRGDVEVVARHVVPLQPTRRSAISFEGKLPISDVYLSLVREAGEPQNTNEMWFALWRLC